MSIDSLLGTHTVTVKRINPTLSGTQWVESHSNRSTGNRARIVPIGGRLAPMVLGRFPGATNSLYILNTVTIYEGDRVQDENNTDENGDLLTYDVLDVRPFFGIATMDHKECVLQRVIIDKQS